MSSSRLWNCILHLMASVHAAPFSPSQAEEMMGSGGRPAQSLLSQASLAPKAHCRPWGVPCYLSDRLLCPHPGQTQRHGACGRKEPSSHSIITLNNVLCKSVTFNASKKGETINRAARKIISMTVFCLKVKQVSYKEQREQDLGKPVVSSVGLI